jgi:hypothetical protein
VVGLAAELLRERTLHTVNEAANRNASRNIARKGEAVWTAGRESRVPTTP